jgi:hypothetical protein
MNKILALEVPKEFYKDYPFLVEDDELQIFLSNMIGYISECNKVELDEIDIESTIKHHSGDCRIWYKKGTYNVLDAKQIIIKCDNHYVNIFKWMEENIPSLYEKHKYNINK